MTSCVAWFLTLDLEDLKELDLEDSRKLMMETAACRCDRQELGGAGSSREAKEAEHTVPADSMRWQDMASIANLYSILFHHSIINDMKAETSPMLGQDGKLPLLATSVP